ncbi:hypothetical protein ACTPEF_26515, partial [Clostridioides difficile]
STKNIIFLSLSFATSFDKSNILSHSSSATLYPVGLCAGVFIIATGHYAKIEKDESTGRYLLKKSVTDKKDQTYALYNLTQEQLE